MRKIAVSMVKKYTTLCIFNPLNAELNPICHLLALLEGASIVDVSGLRVKVLNFKTKAERYFLFEAEYKKLINK